MDGQTKGEAIENIDALPELTEGQKDTFKKQVDVAENEEEILEILAKADNRNELNRTVKEAIDGMPELTEEQRATYKKEVEEATSDDEVESVLSALENQAFENYVESAKDQVDKLTRLTPEEQQDFKNEIGGKASAKDIDEVLGRAYKQNVQKAIDANQAVAKAEDKAKEADKFLKAAAEDGQITEDELKTARGKNEEIEELKEKAQAEIDKLPENVREDLQDRLNKVEAPVLPPVTPSTKVGVANNTIEQSPLDDNRKGIYYEKVKEADQLDDSDNKIDDILAALAAEVEVKKAEDKEAVAESLVKESVADDEVTDGERKAINDANEVVRNLKEDAQKSVNGLSDSVSDLKKQLQERLNDVDEAKIPGDDTKEAKEAVEKAENKAKEADNFLKEAANDAEGITEQDLEKARTYNEDIAELKEKAQAEINKLPENVRKDLQERLNKVKSPGLPPVTPSTKVGSANLAIDGSSLDEARKDYYKEKVKEADSDEDIDDILNALTAEIAVKKAEDKAKEAADLVKKAKDKGSEVTESEKAAIDSANDGVDYYKGEAEPKVTKLPDSVKDIKEDLKKRLDEVKKATLPSGGGDSTPDQDNDQAGTDPGDENDTPADEPKESFNPSAVDIPVDILGSDSDEAGVSAGDHDQIKKGVTDAPEGSTLTIEPDTKVKVGQDGKPRVDVTVTSPDGTETKTVSVPVKQDLNKVVNNKLDSLATHANNKPKTLNKDTVTVKDQEKFRTYNETLNQKKDEIQKLLNDDANAEQGKKKLTEQQRQNLQNKLNQYKPVKTPKTQITVDRINRDAASKNVKDARDRAVHLRVGINEDSEKYGSGQRGTGHGTIQGDTMNFGDGDDTIEIFNGLGTNAKVNLGNGNNELIIHGRGLGYAVFYNGTGSSSVVSGGDGIDTVTLKNDNNTVPADSAFRSGQQIWDVNIPKFDRVNLAAHGGEFNVKYDNIVKHQLGGNGPLIVNGVAGKNNSVDFNYGTRSIENRPGSTFDADGTWTAIKTVKKDGNTYVVWRNSKDNNRNPQHEVWVQDTLNVRY